MSVTAGATWRWLVGALAIMTLAAASSGEVRLRLLSEPLGLVQVVVQSDAEQLSASAKNDRGEPVPIAMVEVKPSEWVGRGVGVDLSMGVVVTIDGLATRIDPEAIERPLSPVPAWAMGATWYQIMPERFRNANPANDPRRHDTYRMPWNEPWFEVSLAEVESAWASAAAGGRRINHDEPGGIRSSVVWNRRLGGDLQGIVEKLDHLAGLGITAIYLTPVFESRSLHKYDASDFRHVDPTLGHPGKPSEHEPSQRFVRTLGDQLDPAGWHWSPADRYLLDVLLPEARKRGMRVILDGVWNHVGLEHFAFEDLVAHGEQSRYAEWFEARFHEDGRLGGWQGWAGWNGSLPEFARHGDGFHPDVERHVFDVTRRWLDPNGDGDPSDGVDGWRLDVAAEVPQAFWRRWRAHVKAINPDAVLIGEIWFPAHDFLEGDQFDAQMNYPFAMAVTAWLGRVHESSAREVAERLNSLPFGRPEVDLVQMNLLDSHDVERIAVMLANPGRGYDQDARIAGRVTSYDPSPPGERAHALAELALAIQVAAAGSPMVYAGNEFGMAGADDPDNRQPIPWADLGPYAAQDRPRAATLERWAGCLNLRRDPELHDVLRYGDMRVGWQGEDLLIIERWLGDRAFVLLVNRSGSSRGPVVGVSPMLDRMERIGGTLGDRVPPRSAEWAMGRLPGL